MVTAHSRFAPVDFVIEALELPNPGEHWLATWGAQGRTSFQITFDRSLEQLPNRQSIHGSFYPYQPSAHWVKFVSALVAAHGVEQVATSASRYDSLPFSAEVIGLQLSRRDVGAIAGVFSESPPGHWYVLRLDIEPHATGFYRGRVKPNALELILALDVRDRRGSLIPVDSSFAPLAFAYFSGLLGKNYDEP